MSPNTVYHFQLVASNSLGTNVGGDLTFTNQAQAAMITCPADIFTNSGPEQCGRTVAFAPTATGVPTPTVVCTLNGVPTANEQWAEWFTAHYNEVAAQYPIYDELFDYAKPVALAKHLKGSGTLLPWFLLANKDLGLTEDSPGTVEALVKNSEHFDGLRIEGGMQLINTPHHPAYSKILGESNCHCAPAQTNFFEGFGGKVLQYAVTCKQLPTYCNVPFVKSKRTNKKSAKKPGALLRGRSATLNRANIRELAREGNLIQLGRGIYRIREEFSNEGLL